MRLINGTEQGTGHYEDHYPYTGRFEHMSLLE